MTRTDLAGSQQWTVTDSHVTTNIFEIDGLPNFLRYGAPLAHLRRAGAPLVKQHRRITDAKNVQA